MVALVKFLGLLALIAVVLAVALVITVVLTDLIANYFDPPDKWPGQR